jgi:hypothetical protein
MVRSLDNTGDGMPELSEDEHSILLNAFLKDLPEQFQKQVCKARKEKFTQEKKQLYWKKIEIETNAPSNIGEFKREIDRRGHEMANREGWVSDFEIDENNKEIYNVLANYFFGNEVEFNGRRIYPSKGLLVFGNVGCGKTVAMRLFEKNPLQCYSFISCRSVETAYDNDGVEAVSKYSNVALINNPTQNYGQQVKGYAFDDLGTESDAKHFGKTLNIMEAIILNRYDNTQLRGAFTHITTNLSKEEIEQRYGVRAFDRFRQMFNIIDFPENAKSRRK